MSSTGRLSKNSTRTKMVDAEHPVSLKEKHEESQKILMQVKKSEGYSASNECQHQSSIFERLRFETTITFSSSYTEETALLRVRTRRSSTVRRLPVRLSRDPNLFDHMTTIKRCTRLMFMISAYAARYGVFLAFFVASPFCRSPTFT